MFNHPKHVIEASVIGNKEEAYRNYLIFITNAYYILQMEIFLTPYHDAIDVSYDYKMLVNRSQVCKINVIFFIRICIFSLSIHAVVRIEYICPSLIISSPDLHNHSIYKNPHEDQPTYKSMSTTKQAIYNKM